MNLNIDKRIAREEGREEGRGEGREEGENRRIIQQVGKKKGKGLSPEVAAEQLESDVQQIRCVYAAMDSLGVTDDVDAIYAELSRQKV